ncbi:MAG: hypothetical protein AAFN77_16720 [Planctomycetota bacterium]
MDTMIWVYLSYLLATILVTILVARTLAKQGAVFITGTDTTPSPITKAKTHLLVVGFYLMCVGLITFCLRQGDAATDAKSGIELFSTKVGGMVLFIGVMHFLMVWVFASMRRAANTRAPERPAYIGQRNPVLPTGKPASE